MSDSPELRPLDDFHTECHMPMAKWLDCVRAGSFIDYDGCGDLATATHYSDMVVIPSMVKPGWKPPAWATHVCWYNR